MRVFFLFLLLIPPSLIAFQAKKPGKDANSQPTFRLPVNVVVVNATITDKKGDPVTDLKQSDFKIYEDGKLQTISTFAKESYLPDQETAEESKIENSEHTGLPHLQPFARTTRPRMISIFIDDLAMNSLDYYPRLSKVLQSYIANDVGPQDHVGILSASGRLQFPFSDDKQLLSGSISGLLEKLNLTMVSRYCQCPEMTEQQAYRVAILNDQILLVALANKCAPSSSDEVANSTAMQDVFRCACMQDQESSYRQLSLLDTLRRHIRSLKHFDAEKNVLIFSDGFLARIEDSPYQLQEIVNLALSSGVVLNCINLRGLESGMDLTKKLDLWVRGNFISGMAISMDDITAQEAPLEQLAYDTGGSYFHNDNDLYKGLKQIIHRQSHYYILTYATPSQKPDGSHHRIKLEVSRPGLEISYRKGYYTPKEQMTFERRKKEDIIDALQAAGNLNEIPVTLSYNCYRNDSSTYGVSFLTNVDIRKLNFLDEDARHKNLISLVLAAYDENGKFIDGLEKTVDLKLLNSSFAGVLRHGFSSRVELKLPFGRYRVKAVVRESVQGKMGSLTKAIEVP
jgi:VWFA-related protein